MGVRNLIKEGQKYLFRSLYTADRPPFGVVFFCRLAAEQGLSPGNEHSLLFAERRKQTVHTAIGGILRREAQRVLLRIPYAI